MIDHEKVADALIKHGGGEGFSIISAVRTGQFVDLRMRIGRDGREYGCVLDLPAPGKWSPYLDLAEFDDAGVWAIS